MFEQLHGVCVYRLYLQLCILVGLPATQLGIFGKIARPLLGEMGNGWEIDEFLVFLVILKQILGDLHFQKTIGIFERFPGKKWYFSNIF